MFMPMCPSDCAETAISMVPNSARPMPTEQISRYFHIASSERSERWKQISGALTSVVASTATQSSPKLREVMTSVMVARNASMQGIKMCSL